MGESNENVWAPWRMEYIEGLEQGASKGECFLCRYRDTPEDDKQNYVLWRSQLTLTLLNRFPYTNGHLLLAPTTHCGRLEALPENVLAELALRIRDAERVLRRGLGAQGFNIGMNIGRCAGAGLPDHLHWHVVPRWEGDTNFMAVTSGVRVIPQTLEAVAEKFLAVSAEMGLS